MPAVGLWESVAEMPHNLTFRQAPLEFLKHLGSYSPYDLGEVASVAQF